MFFYIYHIYYIIYKFSKNNFIKKIKFGTNSKNCFIKKKKYIYFYSIINKISFKINNIKIFQNNFNFFTKVLFFIHKLLFYKKIYGKMFSIYCLEKISFITHFISIINKKKINFQKKIFFFFYIKKKNFLFKKIFFLKNVFNLKSKVFNHNDLFSDNILFLGKKISSFIDLNNFCFLPINNDLKNLYLEFTENYLIKKYIILENYFKKKKNTKYNYNFILKNFLLRKKKMIFLKKIKNPNNYLKKYYYEKNF
ncbi:hypothetical protein [Candidatus Carsonella ruddii]|uniref:hypothetical protein n=1 Tax=Carsonella ruddii TaxID=114186 RepID=UPI003D9A4760